jgi:dUTP pyrophosphatase
MTDLYLCVPEDSSYYTYCDAAYKYNERDPAERDSGFDVYCEAETYMNRGDTAFLKFGITSACAVKPRPDGRQEPRAFWLMPRSSISKTPFICANSVGLIDSGYRGVLMGAIKMVFGDNLETIKAGTRLFQIVCGSAKPWQRIVVVRTVDEFPKPKSERGVGGFGSTGVGYGSGTVAPEYEAHVISNGTSCCSGTGTGSGSGSGSSSGSGSATNTYGSYFNNELQ